MTRPPISRMEGLRPVRAPAELQARTMAAVRAALRRPARGADRWTRIRSSRRGRWLWAASVAILVAGHLVLSIPTHPSPGGSPFDRRLAGAGPEVESLIRLSRIKALPVVDDGSTPSTRRDARQENSS